MNSTILKENFEDTKLQIEEGQTINTMAQKKKKSKKTYTDLQNTTQKT